MAATSGRLIAIGDVHGCAHALEAVVNAFDPAADDTVVFLGDLIDQGPDTRDVLDRIIELRSRCRVALIQGNHEEMLYAARENEQACNFWLNCGGATMLNSYRFGGSLRDIPDEHWELLDQCQPFYETDSFIFSHANYLPETPMYEQPGRQLRWELFDPADMRPHRSGKSVIVGHTEQRNGEVLDLGFAACIDTACWRYGWLTAVEPDSGQLWQASKWGLVRDPGEATHRDELAKLLAKGRS
jgi:serine/threonine protein phosphatase 1